MDLEQIAANLDQTDFQYRIKAIAALREYPAETAVDILIKQANDPEFLVRTFVARELGHKPTPESFAALLEMIKLDDTPSVRAEAANSISFFGQASAPHLVQTFVMDDHWLVRRSIIPALVELECFEEVLEVFKIGMAGEDAAVQEAVIDSLGALAQTPQAETALQELLALVTVEEDYLRIRVAYALQNFKAQSSAQAALLNMQKDTDHKVAGAALEAFI
ncbi:MAG: HEAT repeat domain-containing protein [Cyanobacteria bacterium P01_H01_bin.15]